MEWSTKLLHRLEAMHARAAAATGAIKDALEGMAGQTVSPITERNDFERREAKGQELFFKHQLGRKARPRP